MAVQTQEIGVLIKRNKKGKVRKVWRFTTNDLGWCKARNDMGIDVHFSDLEALKDFVNNKVSQGFAFEGEFN